MTGYHTRTIPSHRDRPPSATPATPGRGSARLLWQGRRGRRLLQAAERGAAGAAAGGGRPERGRCGVEANWFWLCNSNKSEPKVLKAASTPHHRTTDETHKSRKGFRMRDKDVANAPLSYPALHGVHHATFRFFESSTGSCFVPIFCSKMAKCKAWLVSAFRALPHLPSLRMRMHCC
jgi:hypothetical protein